MLSFLRTRSAKSAPSRHASSAHAGLTQHAATRPQATATTITHAGSTRIAYSPQLIDQLEREHRQLLAVYGKIRSESEARRWGNVTILLNEFRLLLQGHLLTENVRLYVYLQHALAHDVSSSNMVREYRSEMDGIGRVALAFLDKYKALVMHPELAPDFEAELAQIGAVLSGRIEREESTLYLLYQAAC